MIISLVAATLHKFAAYGPCRVKSIRGYNASAACYIQLHQQIPVSIATPISSNTVPAYKSLPCATTSTINFDFGPDGLYLNQLVIGISSTEPNYTEVGAGAGVDAAVELDTLYSTNGNETITGDLTTGVDSIAPWTDSAANFNKRLLRADYINGDGATRFLLISADAGTSVMPGQTYQVTNGSTLTLEFFSCNGGGLSTYEQDAAYTSHYGLKILQSTTALCSGLTSSTASNIKALWR